MSEFRATQEKNANNLSMRGGRCKLCASILKLEKSKIKDFYDALLDRTITTATIVEVLSNWDIQVSTTAVVHHRTGKHNHARHIEVLKKAGGA